MIIKNSHNVIECNTPYIAKK